MTEINLFPKQPQSVTVLVFITVLIVLLLILTVMVHTVTALWLETRYILEGFCRILWTMP